MNLGSRWNVIYNKLRNYRYDHWLITLDNFFIIVTSTGKYSFFDYYEQMNLDTIYARAFRLLLNDGFDKLYKDGFRLHLTGGNHRKWYYLEGHEKEDMAE